MITIYCHTSPSKKRYIGQTRQPQETRWRAHCNAAASGSKWYFHRAIRRYGADAFTHEVLEEVSTQEAANEAEARWIVHYNTMNPRFGYNLRAGGNVASPSEQTKRRIRAIWAAKTPEERSAIAKKAWVARTPEERSAIAKKREAGRSPEERSDSAKKRWATRTPEERSTIVKKSNATRTPEERSAIAKKAWAAMMPEVRNKWSRTPEERSAIAKKAWAAKTPEERSAKISTSLKRASKTSKTA